MSKYMPYKSLTKKTHGLLADRKFIPDPLKFLKKQEEGSTVYNAIFFNDKLIWRWIIWNLANSNQNNEAGSTKKQLNRLIEKTNQRIDLFF